MGCAAGLAGLLYAHGVRHAARGPNDNALCARSLEALTALRDQVGTSESQSPSEAANKEPGAAAPRLLLRSRLPCESGEGTGQMKVLISCFCFPASASPGPGGVDLYTLSYDYYYCYHYDYHYYCCYHH